MVEDVLELSEGDLVEVGERKIERVSDLPLEVLEVVDLFED